jgi:ribosomal protein S12 methylthiotransferase
LGVFSYSDDDTSGSFALDGKVGARDIHNRKRKLMSIQRRISRAKNRRMKGREAPVLIEGLSTDTDLLWQARMSTQAPEIDGHVLINDVEGGEPQPGQMRPLRITETHDYDLIGTLLPSTEAAMERNAMPPAPLTALIGISPSQLPAR